jgi:hypothetical protein
VLIRVASVLGVSLRLVHCYFADRSPIEEK